MPACQSIVTVTVEIPAEVGSPIAFQVPSARSMPAA
jgi:hypothetical protein